MNYAYVYYFSDSSKLSEFIVSYESLKATHPKYPIYCMLGEACINQKFVDFLTSIGVGFLICDTPCSIATRNSSGIRTSTFDVAGKMDIFLHTQFDKIVCIDTDTYINKNIDELFNAPDGSMATHHDEMDAKGGGCNSGVLVIKPSVDTWNKLYQAIKNGFISNKFEFKNDQDFLNYIYNYDNNPHLKLNYMYNLIFRLANEYIKNPLFDILSVKIWHMCTPIVQKLEDVSTARCFTNRNNLQDYSLTDEIFNKYTEFYNEVINKYKKLYPYLPLANTVTYVKSTNVNTLSLLIDCDNVSEDNLFAILSNILSQRCVNFKNIQIVLWGNNIPYSLLQNKLFSSLNISVLPGDNTKITVLNKCMTNYAIYLDNFLFISPEMLWEIFEEIKKYPFSTLQFNVVNDAFNECSHVNVFPVNKDIDDVKKIDLQLAVKI